MYCKYFDDDRLVDAYGKFNRGRKRIKERLINSKDPAKDGHHLKRSQRYAPEKARKVV